VLPRAFPAAPRGALLATSARLPPPLQRFTPGKAFGDSAQPRPRILFPPDGARLELATDDAGRHEPIALKVAGGSGALTMLVNGLSAGAAEQRRTLFFQPDGPGFVRLTVMDDRGMSDSVTVRLQ
jgi:penicillin-binding protein 1C